MNSEHGRWDNKEFKVITDYFKELVVCNKMIDLKIAKSTYEAKEGG